MQATKYHGTNAVTDPSDLKCVPSVWDDGEEFAFPGMWVADSVVDAEYYGAAVFAVTFDDPAMVEGDMHEWRVHDGTIMDIRRIK